MADEESRVPDAATSRQPGWREVIGVAAILVAVVLGAAILTSVLPTGDPGTRLSHAARDHRPDRRHRLAALAHLAPDRVSRAMTERRPTPAPASPVPGFRVPPAPLAQRAADITALTSTTWDVVIVGGGIVGCGALLDAVSRGLRAALVEQDDIAAGTSSRSSRLIHGGLRYLEQFRFGLVRQALDERSNLLALAPHLVRIEPFLFPIYGLPYLSKAFYDAGLTLYDVLGARHDGGWHKRLSRAATLELAPTLRKKGLRGGLLYHDGVEDDARYTLAVARTAIAAGGVAVTRVRATGTRPSGTTGINDASGDRPRDRPPPRHDDSGGGRRDRRVGRRAGTSVRRRLDAHPAQPWSAPRRARDRIPNKTGLTIRVPGKIVFLVPWSSDWLIGTTDAPFEGPAARPSAAGWEVDRLLDTVNATMDVDLGRSDVVGTFAGLRPLIDAFGRVHGQGVPRAPHLGRLRRRGPDRRREVHHVPGDGTRRRSMRSSDRDGAKAQPSDTAERRLVGAAEPEALARIADDLATIPARCRRSPTPLVCSSIVMAPRRRPSSRSALSWT